MAPATRIEHPVRVNAIDKQSCLSKDGSWNIIVYFVQVIEHLPFASRRLPIN